ncbi:Polycomb protein esc [Colletotrichum orbiculare MAFF 240422]|uniref:Polycomb protein esc n=1 Tax=Colletotrichum orbiculare (strain 104-T / ATCC 96160 / CBS 514.97 / LARS 414 / MAFF 240422) TaxID=1213857 RepID=A0A484FG24_COLOR|nr:Polycomb protein esc [Colletotrichum orbiculare MAFF 240422]
MAPTTTATPSDFPRLRVSVHLEDDTKHLSQDDTVPEFFDVKFCPYQPLDATPIFAAVSKKHIIVCRLTSTADDSNPCEIISIIRDDDPDARNYYCTWTRDAATGKPLLCYGGEDAKIKVYDVLQGKLVNCLVGHGGDICDVVTSPLDPLLIASCSDDTTVRIWSLDSKHQKQPCLCILGGEGHYWSLLTLAWHDTGRSLVDCVAFYGDYILSRACHDDVIVLWKIEGFSSRDPPPPQSMAPTTINPGNLTRSAFNSAITAECPAPYTRLVEFQTPGCGPQFFMRFKLHFIPEQHPMLAFCNANGKIFFWDFEQITDFHDYVKAVRRKTVNATDAKPYWLSAIVHRSHGSNKAEPTVRERKAAGKSHPTDLEQVPDFANSYNKETLQTWDSRELRLAMNMRSDEDAECAIGALYVSFIKKAVNRSHERSQRRSFRSVSLSSLTSVLLAPLMLALAIQIMFIVAFAFQGFGQV